MPSQYTRFALTPSSARLEEDVASAREAAVVALLDLAVSGWQEDGPRLVFWLPADRLESPDVDEALAMLSRLGELEASIERDEWQLRWRSLHHPVTVGRVCVRPPWTQPAAGAIDVVIDIGLAFGTGSHPTTRECIELLQTLEPGSLLDVGTGSGVLAIAAERLGHHPVVGIDNDELAVGAAWENGMRNGSEATFEIGDALDPGYTWPGVDVVVANLTLSLLVALGERMAAMAESGSGPAAGGGPEAGGTGGARLPRDVIIAGLLDEQAGEAVAAFAGYREHMRLSVDGWTAVHLCREGTGS